MTLDFICPNCRRRTDMTGTGIYIDQDSFDDKGFLGGQATCRACPGLYFATADLVTRYQEAEQAS